MAIASSHADAHIRRTSTVSVVLLAGIAAVVSFRHMHELALLHGEDPLAAALIPLAVDGTIVGASMSLLLASRYGSRGGFLPWALLIVSSLASLGANVAVAEPTLIGRLIAGWPSFALIGAYEMLMSQIRRSAGPQEPVNRPPLAKLDVAEPLAAAGEADKSGQGSSARDGAAPLQRAAWEWAQKHRRPDGALPTGADIARAFERSPRWGRLVKSIGSAGELGGPSAPVDDLQL